VTWQTVHLSLIVGLHGLPGGSTLPQLLAEHGRVESRSPLTIEQVVAWARAHREATDGWPTIWSGKVLGAAGEDWRSIDRALRRGHRGLPRGTGLPRLLLEHCGVESRRTRGPLTLDAILAWGDAHHAATAEWPVGREGQVRGGPAGLTWRDVGTALKRGDRGLPGGMTLVRIWAEHRNRRPALNVERILGWADAHHRAAGSWPTRSSGAVAGERRETWGAIDQCLKKGCRGLPGGQWLSDLLAQHRGVRKRKRGRSRLTIERILAWADAHRAATGEWPNSMAAPVIGVRGETWAAVCAALYIGGRGLTVRTTLARLLIAHRGLDVTSRPSRLTIDQILAWADAHQAATGHWPTRTTGPVTPCSPDTWYTIDLALRHGGRGLPRGRSLARLLAEHLSQREGDTHTVEFPA
jgi:hypothetical protein